MFGEPFNVNMTHHVLDPYLELSVDYRSQSHKLTPHLEGLWDGPSQCSAAHCQLQPPRSLQFRGVATAKGCFEYVSFPRIESWRKTRIIRAASRNEWTVCSFLLVVFANQVCGIVDGILLQSKNDHFHPVCTATCA